MKRVVPEPDTGVLPTLYSEEDQNPKLFKYQAVWHRAVFRIRVRKALSVVNDEIILYGTSSDFLDMDNNYRPNVGEILWKKQNKQENFRHFTSTIADVVPWHVIHPESTFANLWSSLLVMLLIYTASVMPIRVAFYEVVFFDSWTIADICIDFLFALDIVVNCITAFERRDGGMETNHMRIMFVYAKTWLFFDILACLPFSLIEYSTRGNSDQPTSTNRYNSLVRLARVPRLYKLLRILRIAKAFKRLNTGSLLGQFAVYVRGSSRKL